MRAGMAIVLLGRLLWLVLRLVNFLPKPLSPFLEVLGTTKHWLGCYSHRLESTAVDTPFDAEIPLFAPVGSPTVLDNPVLALVLVLAVADHQHSMRCLLPMVVEPLSHPWP